MEQQAGAKITLRERNKEKKRAAVYRAVRELLLAVGYDKMTMEAIAEKAEVGVATVYKYFGTKDRLVMELLRRDLEEMMKSVNAVLVNPPGDLADAVVALLEPPLGLQLVRHDRNLVMHSMVETWDIKGDIQNSLVSWAKQQLSDAIEKLLRHFRKRGQFSRNINLRKAAMIIYSIFDYNYFGFARGDIATLEDMAALTREQVRMLFDDWRSAG